VGETRLWSAINRALDEELARDDRVLLFGEDVALPGGIFGVTRGLVERHGSLRVFDVPIAENAFVGAAVGAAMTGMRPVVEVMFMDFSLVAADQIVNHAAKVRFMTQGAYHAPMVIRIAQGDSPLASPQHSQSFEALFATVPGLKVVAPSCPHDAYGLLKSAIRDDDPVIFLEDRNLYQMTGPVPPEEFLEPIGSAKVVREGGDLTIVAWSGAVHWATDVADKLADHGVDPEVIDLRSMQPIDYATLERSAVKTGRVAIIQESVQAGGLGAEIAATLAERLGRNLLAPVRRFGAAFMPSPVVPDRSLAPVPQLDKIVSALLEG
jgi:acetoin:2,6-dichlorophenolindophenol oxidoreductase subunit beta